MDKIEYKQHRSVRGLGLSIVAAADFLTNLLKAGQDILSENKIEEELKSFNNNIKESLQLVESEKSKYVKDKAEIKKARNPLKRVKLEFDLRKKRRAFATKLNKVYDSIKTEMQNLKNMSKVIDSICGKITIIEKHKEKESEKSEKPKKFLISLEIILCNEERKLLETEIGYTIHDLNGVGESEAREMLLVIKTSIDDFLKKCDDISIKKLKNDLKYMMRY